jgi:amino-acid N-acetyltransferase
MKKTKADKQNSDITKKHKGLLIRKATVHDVKGIHKLIGSFAKRRVLLPRSLSHIYDNIRDFFVCESRAGNIIGCAALHIVWENLAEIKSLVVSQSYQKKGIGKSLVAGCLDEARMLGAERVFALTFKPEFFLRSGFVRIGKNRLPATVWRECIECHMFPDCDEVAVIKSLRRKKTA